MLKMDSKPEKSKHLEPSSPKFIVKVAAALLLLALTVATHFTSQFEAPVFIFYGLLISLAQSLIGIVYFDQIWQITRGELRGLILTSCSVILTVLTFCFVCVARSSSEEVYFIVCCFYIIWGGLFEIGLGFARYKSHFPLARFFCMMAVVPVTDMLKVQTASWALAWLYLIPFCLGLVMTIWEHRAVVCM